MPSLEIQLLGEFRLVYDNQALTTIQQSARLQTLVVFLALHREAPQSRQRLAFLLWPDSSEAQARGNLRRELFNLRRALPDADRFLQVETRSVQWRPNAPYRLDVVDFQHLLDVAQNAEVAGQTDALRAALQQAVEHYQGPFFPGNYDEWVLAERERLGLLYVKALEQLCGLLEDAQEYAAAIDFSQRLLRHDHLFEAAYRRLMRLYALNDNRAQRAAHLPHLCHRAAP